MLYSLLRRFQGAIFGSLLPEVLLNSQETLSLSAPSQVSIAITNVIINSGTFSWTEIEKMTQGKIHSLNTSSELARGTLPLALFFHDNLELFKQNLQELKKLDFFSEETLTEVIIWARTISLILIGKLTKQQLIEAILREDQELTSLTSRIIQLKTWSTQGLSLSEVERELVKSQNKSNSFFLAFYCFFNSEDFSLCLKNAMNSKTETLTISVLTGVLAGLYHSLSGIPISWRLALKEKTSGEEIKEISENLFAAWAGVYQPRKSYPKGAISSPKIIQTRSSKNIISQ